MLHGKLTFHLDVEDRRLGMRYGHVNIGIGFVLGAWIVGKICRRGVASMDAVDHSVVHKPQYIRISDCNISSSFTPFLRTKHWIFCYGTRQLFIANSLSLSSLFFLLSPLWRMVSYQGLYVLLQAPLRESPLVLSFPVFLWVSSWIGERR